MSIMLAQMGLSLAGSIGEFATSSIQAGLQQKIQNYKNTMTKLSAARSQNAVSINEARTRDAGIRADQMIQKTAMKDQARAEVNAAAAGVAGTSVDMVMRDLKGSAARASYAQRRQVREQQQEMGEQRTSIAIAGITQQDVQVIPRPSVSSLLMGAGTNLLNIYDSHQPPGERLLED